jgi:hypothetical protein
VLGLESQIDRKEALTAASFLQAQGRIYGGYETSTEFTFVTLGAGQF